MKNVLGVDVIKKSIVFEWQRRFKNGRGDVKKSVRIGRPKSQRTDANVDKVLTLVRSDRILSV